MKKALLSIGVIGFAFILIGCQSRNVSTQTITHYSLTKDSIKFVQGLPTQQPISISVSYEFSDGNNEVSRVTLANGPLVDGELKLEQTITEPTEVVISATFVTDDITRETTAVLRPDTTVEFVVFDRVTKYGNNKLVLLKGNDHRSLHENQRFSIKGDLSQLRDFDPNLAHVRLIVESTFPDYSEQEFEFDPVLADEGEFSIEGDLDEPTLFAIAISKAPYLYHIGMQVIPAILEPGVNYRVVPSGTKGRYVVVAEGESMHTQLVSSWQLDPKFVGLVDRSYDDYLDWEWGMEREVEEEHDEEQIRNYQVAEQCSHLSLTDAVKSRFVEPYKPAFETTADEMVKIRTHVLRTHLRNAQDPDTALMIVDLTRHLRGRDWRVSPPDEWVAMLEDFALKMDDEYVDQFITPEIESVRRGAELAAITNSLRPGQIARQFTLTSIAGDEISLKEALSKNKLVLVNFWASDCYACMTWIAGLKQVYAEYEDQGFEVVSISIDENLAEWESASEELDLPWIDLGYAKDVGMKARSAATHVEYGVSHLPAYKLLLDGEGCIVQKPITHSQLKEVLRSQLAEIAN